MAGEPNSQSPGAGGRIQRRLDILVSPETRNSLNLRRPAPVDILRRPVTTNLTSTDISELILNQTEANSPMANARLQPGKSVWAELGSALRALRLTSTLFPPLEAVATQLLDYFDDLESAEKNRQEFLTWAKDLERILRQLNEYLPLVNERMYDEVRNVAWNIQDQIEIIKKQRSRGTFKRMMRLISDSDEMIRCHRRIEVLFTQLQVDVSMSTRLIVDETLAESRLRAMGPVYEASYNSTQSTDVKRRACTENTRVTVMAEVWEWIMHPDSPKVYWMNGMAGTGKTTVAYTTCAQLEVKQQLGANFFCSRALPGCRDVGRIIPTIAYQLARFSPLFKSQLCQTLAHDPDASTRDLNTQFLKLLKGPVTSIKDTMPSNIVVLIDALDELDGPSNTRLLLQVIFEHVPEMPLKFFITSRPDHGLYDIIMSQGSRLRNVFHLHEIEKSFVQADIETYLNVELGLLSLPSNQVRQLAEQSGRLFIYAATAVEYIEPDDPEADHGIRLASLLEMTSNQPTPRQQKIDDLYVAILRTVFEKPNRDLVEIEHIKLILWSIVCAEESLTPALLANLLQFDNDQRVLVALKPLRSVIHVSERTGHISTLHASFLDFVFNPKRSGHYACDRSTHHGLLAKRCFELMQSQLRFNICKFDSAFHFDSHVPNLPETISITISPELFYACQHWGAHLQFSSLTDSLIAHFHELMLRRLLAWMEVLTLKKMISRAESILSTIERWLQGEDTVSNLRQLVHDAWKFATSFAASPASASTPHIYLSTLALWHPESPMFKLYGYLVQDWIRVEQTSVSHGNTALLATWDNGADSRVNSIALSVDGSRLVSGHSTIHRTGDIRVWDVRTGSGILGQSMAHASGVRAVAFSCDGTRIVSGCSDRSVYIWDAATGEVISGPFIYHNKAVNCVAFSHDILRIISGSEDGTVHVIDSMTGTAIAGPFRNHTRAVNSIAMSPDGAHFASGSDDHTIYVRELHSGSYRGPFIGHMDGVLSVAYSPCGTRIVSGSLDRTIRVWNSLTGSTICGPFGRYTGEVYSVLFSPDGSYIIAGLSDYTVCVCDSSTGQTFAGPFQGHSAPVNAVTISSDGARIFSGSSDGTICVWDVRSSTSIAAPDVRPMGHNAPVNTISTSLRAGAIFSITSSGEIGTWDMLSGKAMTKPTALLAASINTIIPSSLSNNGQIATKWQNDISIWDTSTGMLVAGPFRGHTNEVQSAAVSPDGTLVISGSKDNTILVWSMNAPSVPVKVFKRHTAAVTSIAFSPNGKYVASGSDDTVVFVWNIQEEHSYESYEGHTQSVTSLDFSPESARVVSGSTDCTIRVWDIIAGDSNKVTGVSGSHSGPAPVDCVKFSPNGDHIVSSSSDYSIWVWDATTARVIVGPLKGHTDRVRAIAFSPDGTRIISGSQDRTIRNWDVSAAAYTPNAFSNINAAFGPDVLGSWRLDDRGWVLDKAGRLLMWIPKPLRPALGWPCNPLVMSTAGSLQLPMAGLLEGRIWREMYQRQESGSSLSFK
ncbi:WD40-repeat-containing domain protein [Rhizoctonia solani]|nr:WD40-repeat-containing domain protein [Rhizoctonia solani]